MQNRLQIGVIGLGTVGSGVIDVLKKNASLIQRRTGLSLEITWACDLEIASKGDLVQDVTNTTTDYTEVLASDVDIVVELIGGYTVAKEVTLAALKAGKTVVTANKALLAVHGREVFGTARNNNVEIGFEAAVAGTIPIIRALQSGLAANTITAIQGILNGTTNYILTKMTKDGADYDVVLKKAQELGFAEADPTFDVEGIDAAHKITLLAWLGFGAVVDFASVSAEGITKITSADIQYADRMGYLIKLLGIAKNTAGGIECRVHPTMIRKSHPLAHVNNEVNAVYVDSDFSDQTVYIGKGAGSHPTAAAIVSDLIYFGSRRLAGFTEPELPTAEPDATLKPAEEIQSRYYFRFCAVDKPGVLAQISKVLGAHNISISQVAQDEDPGNGDEPDSEADIIVVSHPALEGNVQQALKEIAALDDITGETVVIRVE